MLETTTAFEFFYWLQGAIEIGGMTEIDTQKRELILMRLQQVRTGHPFIMAAKYLLEHYEMNIAFDAINKELQSIFIHDVDPTYEGDQELFYATHEGRAEVI